MQWKTLRKDGPCSPSDLPRTADWGFQGNQGKATKAALFTAKARADDGRNQTWKAVKAKDPLAENIQFSTKCILDIP
jgi:hypothetical protein